MPKGLLFTEVPITVLAMATVTLTRTLPALAAYDAASEAIDAYEGADVAEVDALFAAYDARLADVAEAFAEDTAHINNATDVINAITHGGRRTGHAGAMLAWVRRLAQK